MQNLNIISEYYEKKSYNSVIDTYESLSNNKEFINDNILEKVVISYYRNKNFLKAMKVAENISNNYLNKNYFINEILGICYLQLNKLYESYNCYVKALSLNQNLVSAFHQKLVLQYRLFKEVDIEDLNKSFFYANKNKNIRALREVAYIYYSIGYYKQANKCFDIIIQLGDKLNFVDQLSYSLIGINHEKFSYLEKNREKNFFKRNFIDNGGNHLVISVSYQENFILKSYKFNKNMDVLYIGDATNSYYAYYLKDVVDFILKHIKHKNYEKVSLVGASKGATACLMIYSLLSKRVLPFTKINVISFSPQINIYPFNENLSIPSYREFSKLFGIHSTVESIIKRLPKLEMIDKKYGDKIFIIYGNKYRMDKIEAESLNNEDINLISLNFSGHSTIFPYTVPEGITIDEMKDKYSRMDRVRDSDFQALSGGNIMSLVDEIYTLSQNPDINLNKLLTDFDEKS